jgi:hypothetical protein
MRIPVLALFILSALTLGAQVSPDLRAADIIARNAPDSVQATPDGLGKYFAAMFSGQKYRVRAIFCWTASSISYDASKFSDPFHFQGTEELAARTMQTRSAVCQGYTAVFKALCDRCNIRAYIVNGYTRQNGHITNISHSWVIALIDSAFYGFDPTWGGGYMVRNRFVRHFNEEFFMIRPGDLIRDHMPFDPMWECLPYPVSNLEFTGGLTEPEVKQARFYYADSIPVYIALPVAEQYKSSLRRLENAGITNKLLREWEKYLQECIANESVNKQNVVRNKYVRQFNDAVADYNHSISLFNGYIDYWNRGFLPSRPELEIVAMLDSCYYYIDASKSSLSQVVPDNDEIRQSIDQLRQAIDIASGNLDRQKTFLKVYFNTEPAYRSQLFRTYNGAGFPNRK